MKIRLLFVVIPLLLISGCAGLSGGLAGELDDQEYILLKVNNNVGLLKLYRERLQNKEDPKTRFKVAEYYNLLEDYESSRHFLAPLLASSPTSDMYLLESKNLLELGKKEDALVAIDKAISLNKNNGEAYNIKGVILAEFGYFDEAINSFNMARETFLADNIVMNNIAMVYILKEDYNKALEYLMPLYLRGDKSPKLVHNLVLCLIKTHDYVRAENVIRDENIPEPLEKLIVALSDVQVAIKESKYEPKNDSAVGIASANRSKTSQGNNANGNEASAFLLVDDSLVINSANTSNSITESSLIQSNNIAVADSTLTAMSVPEQPKMMDTSITSGSSTLPVANAVSDNKSPENIVKTMDSTTNLVISNSASRATISDVRMSDNPKGSRLVIESDKEIKFTVLTAPMDNQLIIELNNFNQSNLLSNTGLYLRKRHKTIENIMFTAPENDKVKMIFQFKRKMKSKVYRLGPEGHYKDRIVIDLTD